MILDELWRAERRAKKERKRIHEKFDPLLETAKKAKDEEAYQSALHEFLFQNDLNDGPEVIRTDRLLNAARKLGVVIPPKPAWDSPELYKNEDWHFNQANGNWVLSDEVEFELRRKVRIEENERLEHQMRWVNRVVLPMIGLLGTIMGLISLIHALK